MKTWLTKKNKLFNQNFKNKKIKINSKTKKKKIKKIWKFKAAMNIKMKIF